MYGIREPMSWEVENTDEFGGWFVELSDADRDGVDFPVDLLIAQGPNLALSAHVGDWRFAAPAHALACGFRAKEGR